MLPAFSVFETYDFGKDADDDVVISLFFPDLARHQAQKTALLGIQFCDIFRALADDVHVKGAGDIVGRAHVIGFLNEGRGVFGGDHHDGDVIEPVFLLHDGEYIEAPELRHDDVEKYEGDLCAVLIEEIQALFTVCGFEDLVMIAQHFFQEIPVHLRIIDDEDLRLRRKGIVQRFFIFHIFVHDHGIFIGLGIVHELVRTGDDFFDAAIVEHGAADAGRDLKSGKFGEICLMDVLLDAAELLCEDGGGDIGHDEEKFISTIADQLVCAADAFLRDLYQRLQGGIACAVAEGVVVELQVIEVDQSDTGNAGEALHFVLPETAVVRAGQGIDVELLAEGHQLIIAFRKEEVCIIDVLQHFQNVGHSFDHERLRKDLVHFAIDDLEVEMHALIGKGGPMGIRSAEFTRTPAAIIPCGKPGIIRGIPVFGMRSLDKTYYGKNLPQTLYVPLHVFHGR